MTYDFHNGSGNNGDVYSVTDNLDGTRTQSYTYDSLNRLLTAGTTSTWGNSYGYDAWGNLTSKTVTRGTAESVSLPVNSNNQFVGWTYDRGNARNTPGGPYDTHFNAENQ